MPVDDVPGSMQDPSENPFEMIIRRAFEIYRQRGWPEADWKDWVRAEGELRPEPRKPTK